MKKALTISIDLEVKERAKEIMDQEGKKLSPVIELYLKELIKAKEENGENN